MTLTKALMSRHDVHGRCQAYCNCNLLVSKSGTFLVFRLDMGNHPISKLRVSGYLLPPN